MARRPPGQAQGQAQARWADIQNRADDLAQTLYRMRETAPDEDSRVRVDDVLAALQSVRTAMDAERAPGRVAPSRTSTRAVGCISSPGRSARCTATRQAPGLD